MKTILTATFAIAVMVFAFNTDPVMAGDVTNPFKKFGQGEKQIDDLEQTAQYEPDCRWKWRLDTNTGNWGWVCEYYNEGETPGDNVAWDTEPGGDAYCWESVGRNGPVIVCAPDDSWNSENDNRELAGYADYCKRSGNCMMFEDDDGDGEFEVAGRYHDSRSLDLDRDRKDYNDSQKNRVAYGCKIQSDGSMHCPGDAWNEDADSRDGFGGRNVADSGNEDPTSVAQESDQ